MPVNRRQFLAQSGMLLSSTMLAKTPTLTRSQTSGRFSIRFFCPRWGATDSWDSFCQRVKKAGYDGVEYSLPFDGEKQEAINALKKHNLLFIGQYWQSFEADIEENARSYERHVRNQLSANPIFINCQTGKDWFSFENNKRLVDLAVRLSDETGVKITHETHRGKLAFAAHVTADYLMRIPEMRLTLDISHWCAVHESLLGDQAEAVEMALARTDHIHSRVGHPEGPQVSDPRAPEWADTLAQHLVWWDKVVALHRQEGTPLTITTEFGPPAYMPVLPYTRQPVANQFDINVFMLGLLKKRYLNP